MQRVCAKCSEAFEYVYAGTGRPRIYCLSCQPVGRDLVKPGNASTRRWKLRRAQHRRNPRGDGSVAA